MAVELSLILQTFPHLLQLVHGDLKTSITGLNSPPLAQAHDLIFISDKKHFLTATQSRSQNWVIQNALIPLTQDLENRSNLRLLSSQHVTLALALIGKKFFPIKIHQTPFLEKNKIHPSAVLHPSVQLGQDVLVGPNTTIGEQVKIGDHCIIGSNTTIEPHVQIGHRTHIHSQVYIAHSTQIGHDCEIQPQTSIGTEGFGYAHDPQGQAHRITHYGSVRIEDRVHIGAGVQIDRGTFENSVIGAGTIIDNHCHFGHNIHIGEGTIITGGLLAAGSVTIGKRCVFGGRTTISGHLKIADGSRFAGLSGIPSDVTVPGQYGGYPLQSLRAALKTTASLAHLPRMRRSLNQILKHLGLEHED